MRLPACVPFLVKVLARRARIYLKRFDISQTFLSPLFHSPIHAPLRACLRARNCFLLTIVSGAFLRVGVSRKLRTDAKEQDSLPGGLGLCGASGPPRAVLTAQTPGSTVGGSVCFPPERGSALVRPGLGLYAHPPGHPWWISLFWSLFEAGLCPGLSGKALPWSAQDCALRSRTLPALGEYFPSFASVLPCPVHPGRHCLGSLVTIPGGSMFPQLVD